MFDACVSCLVWISETSPDPMIERGGPLCFAPWNVMQDSSGWGEFELIVLFSPSWALEVGRKLTAMMHAVRAWEVDIQPPYSLIMLVSLLPVRRRKKKEQVEKPFFFVANFGHSHHLMYYVVTTLLYCSCRSCGHTTTLPMRPLLLLLLPTESPLQCRDIAM